METTCRGWLIELTEKRMLGEPNAFLETCLELVPDGPVTELDLEHAAETVVFGGITRSTLLTGEP